MKNGISIKRKKASNLRFNRSPPVANEAFAFNNERIYIGSPELSNFNSRCALRKLRDIKDAYYN